MRKLVVLTVQIIVLIGFAVGGNWLATRLSIPIPGSILAMVVLFLLLQFGVVKLKWIEIGADWYIRHLLLFFIPPALGIMEYPALIRAHGWQLLLTIAVSTALVMACTGLMAERIAKRRRKSGIKVGNEADKDLIVKGNEADEATRREGGRNRV